MSLSNFDHELDDAPERTSTGQRSAFLFLLALGLGNFGAGAAFAFGPPYSWQLTRISRTVAELGIENGSLLVGGMFFLALAFMFRSQARMQASRNEVTEGRESDLSQIVDQLASEVARIRAGIQQVGDNVVVLARGQQEAQAAQAANLAAVQSALLSALQEASADFGQPSNADAEGREALFRLAASLDKLHARIDEGLNGFAKRMGESSKALAIEVRESKQATLDKVESLVSAARKSTPAQPAPQPRAPQAAHAQAPARRAPAPGSELAAHRPLSLGQPQQPSAGPQPHFPTVEPAAPFPSSVDPASLSFGGEELDIVVDLDAEDLHDPQANEFFQTVSDLDAMVQDPGFRQEGTHYEVDRIEIDDDFDSQNDDGFFPTS